MKNHLKSNKGVSLIMLVITIILMIILASYAVYYSYNIAPEAKLAAAFTSLKEIKNACNRAILEIEMDPSNYDEYYFFGDSIQKEENDTGVSGFVQKLAEKCGVTADDFSERTYLISNDGTDASKRRLVNLEISSISESYIVDLENEKYYILGGVKRANKEYVYEYRDIELMYDMITKTK